MASLNESPNSNAVKGRTKKAAPRVDLTAMVDLMFLLTTFFMLTTSMSEPKAADIAKPIESEVRNPYPASRTMTIVLGKDNKAISYIGVTESAQMKLIDVNKIQQEIAENKRIVADANSNNPSKYLIVIIKPSKTSKFKDFVDAIDEMKIADIKSYAIDDDHLSVEEEDFMKKKGI
ncbi:biopolymer transporter ExbD [Pedobacter frigidisoli]|uniref:Biopolymer transporter ExbD n=1 Tax=Pedobacter frigidisoli TaxID=2530455 RepID=A0A4R0P6P1_9SPHI|nr:biopolymer transporter ExbD [Pedobacter frigidisoli]TCD11571.1 biopolymer transporter ExbD [Pedobacter frigidisoli]